MKNLMVVDTSLLPLIVDQILDKNILKKLDISFLSGFENWQNDLHVTLGTVRKIPANVHEFIIGLCLEISFKNPSLKSTWKTSASNTASSAFN